MSTYQIDVDGAPKTGVLKNGLVALCKITPNYFLASDGVIFQSVSKPFFKTPVFGAPLSSSRMCYFTL